MAALIVVNAIKFYYSVDESVLNACAQLRVLVIERMVQNVLSDKLGTSGDFTFRSGHEKFKNLLDLLLVIRAVSFDLHELSDHRPETGEVTLLLTAKDFVYVQFFIFGRL